MKEYKYSELLEATTIYFNGDELAATTWINKYAMKDRSGNYLELTPAAMHRRMAVEFARKEAEYSVHEKKPDALSAYGKSRPDLDEEKIFSLLENFRLVIPQGSIMAALGNPYLVASLSNCVVLPEIYDSYGGIFFTDQQLAQLNKRRCGAGIDLSTLRPAGMHVSNAAGTTTGAVSFMERFSNTTREVSQNGRRGALMITMDIAHPDIAEFILSKQQLNRITGANISVRVSDAFMQAVNAHGDFTLQFPVDSPTPQVRKVIRARELWDLIVNCAHKTAEPGIIFWDRQHKYSTSSIYPHFRNVSTNPCSEIAMQGGDSCRLMAINLFGFVKNPFTVSAEFDSGKFYEVTYECQRLMDDLVDLELEAISRIIRKVENDPEPIYVREVELRTWKKLQEEGRRGRRTGLGITALADMFAALNMKFDSTESLAFAGKIFRIKCEAEFDSSIDMSITRGSFEGFDADTEEDSEFIRMLKNELPEVYERNRKFGRRNISISTVAPTGTLSILAQTSSGIEPVFMTSYKRRRKSVSYLGAAGMVDSQGDTWEEFQVIHPGLKKWMNVTGNQEVLESPYHQSTAAEIDWRKRVELQSVIQKYVTHSISSTINLSSDVTAETIAGIYQYAWELGLKGITVYREGSRMGVLVSDEPELQQSTLPAARPERLESSVLRFMNGREPWVAFVGLLGGNPYEIFTGKAGDSLNVPPEITHGWILKIKQDGEKSGYDFRYADGQGNEVTIEGLSRTFDPEYWNYARLISGVLRHGMPLIQVINLVRGLHLSNENINSWKAGVERALTRFIPAGSVPSDTKCPVCGDPEGLIYEEGCIKCTSCGQTQCG